jgi:hypothetical protein
LEVEKVLDCMERSGGVWPLGGAKVGFLGAFAANEDQESCINYSG